MAVGVMPCPDSEAITKFSAPKALLISASVYALRLWKGMDVRVRFCCLSLSSCLLESFLREEFVVVPPQGLSAGGLVVVGNAGLGELVLAGSFVLLLVFSSLIFFSLKY